MEVETLLATWQAAFSLAARHRSGCTGIYDVLLFLTSVLVLRASIPLFLRLLWCPLLLTGLCCTCCNFALLNPCLQMPECPSSCRLDVPSSPVPKLILFLHYFTLVTEPDSFLSLSGHGLSLNSVSWYCVLFLQPTLLMIEYAEDVFKASEIGQTEKNPLWNYAVEVWAVEYITFGSYLFAEWIVQKWLHM